MFRLQAALLVAIASGAWGCGCITGDVTPCSAAAGADVVFVGKVTRDASGGLLKLLFPWGLGSAKFKVIEVLHGLPQDAGQVKVDVRAGSSCYMPVKWGDTYVIFAARDSGGKLRSGGCSQSFPLKSNESVLAALRRAEKGESTIVGSVKRSDSSAVEGLRIIAQQSGTTLEMKVDAQGAFSFLGPNPGEWSLHAEAPGLVLKPYLTADSIVVAAGKCTYTDKLLEPEGQ